MEPEKAIYVESVSVSCDGGGGAKGHPPMGHPNVYLDVGKKGEAVCPYCGRHFILSGGAGKAAGH